MKIIGFTGQTGVGKTTALQGIKMLGGEILDCDALYAQVLREDTGLKTALCDEFCDILNENDEIDRKKLGSIVFEDPVALERLNGITLPVMKKYVENTLANWKEMGYTIVAIDAILLIESGLVEICDATIAITAPQNLRLVRIMKRDGISEEYARNRIKSQKSEEFYIENCDYQLRNDHFRAEDFSVEALELLKTMVTHQ
ncbi:MAG: dephospho-CoA kinase [Eubacteriales bacterium]